MHHQHAAGILLNEVPGSSRSKKYIIVEKNIVPVIKNIESMHNSRNEDLNVYPNT